MKICITIILQLFYRQEGEQSQRIKDRTGHADETSNSTPQASEQAEVEALAVPSGSNTPQCDYNILLLVILEQTHFAVIMIGTLQLK